MVNYSEMEDTLENLKVKQLPMLSKFMLKIRGARKKAYNQIKRLDFE